MIYTPSRNPKKAMILITVIVAAGILGGHFAHKFFAIVALLFWIQYTAILSYLQFKRSNRRKKKHTGVTKHLLNPQIRFFLFEFLAVIGIASIFKFQTLMVANSVLVVWWLFALNFYAYYKKRK